MLSAEAFMTNRGDSTQTSAMMMSPQCHASSHGPSGSSTHPSPFVASTWVLSPPTSRSHPWRAVSVLLGRPALEQVRRLHDRAVDRDDERNLTRYRFPRLLECPKAMSDSRASQLTGLGGRGQLRSCRRSSRSRRRAAPSLLPLPCLVGALPATPARERGSSDAGSRSRT
jgi:hypothetical protein